MKQLPLALSLNPNSTFENFFVNQNNAVVLNIIEQFLHDEEPFIYIWSQPGDGVSHLLEAVQLKAGQHSLCQYLPLPMLLDYPAQDITDGLDQMDLVCIDDIECVSEHLAWQQALFHLYNQLRDGGKKLIVAGHTPPGKLSFALQDLKSRLQWGAVLYIEPLNDEEKAEAMKQRAESLGIYISDEVLHFLLTRIERSNATLYKILARLDKESMAEKRKLTIPFVKEVLSLS